MKQFDFHQVSERSDRFFIGCEKYIWVFYFSVLCVGSDTATAGTAGIHEGICNFLTTSFRSTILPIIFMERV